MQNVPSGFNDMAQNGVRPHIYGLYFSFDKAYDDTRTFFTLDVSVLDGPDLLAPNNDNPLQQWDYYDYDEYTDRVIMMQWDREIQFPFSVQAGMADVSLNNYDGYFTPSSDSPLSDYILPGRPLKLFSGFEGFGKLQQFVGITQKMPIVDDKDKTANFHALDFLSEIFILPMNETVALANVRTDEVLEAIFTQFGLSPAQYSLPKGRNTIPFFFAQKGDYAGDILRKLMQAEMGQLWIDEQGIIRFRERLELPQDPVIEFNDTNVEYATNTGDSDVINKVVIRSVIRDVQEFQPIYEKVDTDGTADLYVIAPNSTKQFEISLTDPCLDVVEPTLGFASGVSWFTVKDSADDNVASGVSVDSSELRLNTYVLTFENTNSFAVEINAMEVWGEPAKQVDYIEYEAKDQDSIDIYGDQVLEIENDYFGSYSNCDSFAETIIDACKDYAGFVELGVKGDPTLQLNDVITVDTRNISGTFRINKITNTLQDSKYTQIIKARRYNPREWFVLDVSVLDGTDVLAP